MRSLVGIALAAIVAHHSDVSSAKLGPHEVDVVASDYAFTMPRELPAGPTTFHFRNNGNVYHEMVIFILKPGVTIDDFVRTAAEQKSYLPLTDAQVGILFSGPGKRSSSTLSTELLTGRQYLVWCGFRDTTTAPRHIAMGMYSMLNVRPSKEKVLPAKVKADTIVSTDYAFRYTRTLSPGRHTIVFRNEGKVRHEVNIILPKRGVTFEQMFAVRRARQNPRPLNEDQLGVLYSSPGERALGRLDVNLLPGREYRIICSFMDDPKAPPHYALGMYGSIQVGGKPAG
jgi:hypothetical protein